MRSSALRAGTDRQLLTSGLLAQPRRATGNESSALRAKKGRARDRGCPSSCWDGDARADAGLDRSEQRSLARDAAPRGYSQLRAPGDTP